MRVAIATAAAVPLEFTDDERLADALRALGAEVARISWDDPGADWDSFDSVVIRSTWDHASRRGQFVSWAESVGAAPPQRPRRCPLEQRQALPR